MLVTTKLSGQVNCLAIVKGYPTQQARKSKLHYLDHGTMGCLASPMQLPLLVKHAKASACSPKSPDNSV